MKNDLFFMSVAILAVWREHDPKSVLGVVISDEAGTDYEIKMVIKKNNKFEMLLDLFDDFSFDNANIYMTMTPWAELISAAEAKNVRKLLYIPTTTALAPTSPNIIVHPFEHTFGRIIDMLSCYKPRDLSINKV
jgi:hypothetical protein